jgi:hypothetical protein
MSLSWPDVAICVLVEQRDSKTASTNRNAGQPLAERIWRPASEQAKKMRELQKESAQLRRAITDPAVEKEILKDVADGNF